MAELTETALNEAADVMEAVADQAEVMAEATRGLSPRDIFIGLFAGLVIGGAAGAFYMERRLRTKYQQIAEDEIDQMREHFRARLVAKEVKPEISELGKKVENLGYRPAPIPVPDDPMSAPEDLTIDVEPETQNVFTKSWDYEVEEAIRAGKSSYVIHYDERHQRGYTETTLTYYEGDDVLCDDKDKIVEDQDMVVGLENLDKFGHGSNDPNIVYVRNDELSLEVEVIKSPRTYAEDVHGMTHSDPPHDRRPRWDG